MNRSTMAELVRDFGPAPDIPPLPVPGGVQVYVLPTIAPRGFWLPPWRLSRGGITIPAPPMPAQPGPGGAVSIKPDNVERFSERPSGLWEPVARLEWMGFYGGVTITPADLQAVMTSEVSRATDDFWRMVGELAGQRGGRIRARLVRYDQLTWNPADCPCPDCRREVELAGDVDEVRPPPVYDHAPLERGGVDNDADPEWGTRVSSEGPGLLLEELLDDSTLKFLEKRRQVKPATRPPSARP